MNIYLIFDKIDNIQIFDLEIAQEEDCFAKARLVIEAGQALPPTGTEGILREDEDLFKGALVGVPVKITGNFSEIELIAKPSGVAEKIKHVQKDIHIHPYWDALWHKESDKLEEMQDAHTSSLYCDRRTGEMRRSDWFEGRQKIVLQKNFFQQSLRSRIVTQPLKACTVNVHAHWIQKQEGVTNLSGAIRKAFPHARVSTYTKDALFAKWPEPGRSVGRSGIWIVKSNLKEIASSSPLYPSYSPTISLNPDGESPTSYRLKRHWFKPTLWVGWQYHQKRQETLSVTLHHAFQSLYPGEGEHKVIDFTLQNINPAPNMYPWQPTSLYNEGTKVSYRDEIYQCKTTHAAGLSFEDERDKWAFQTIFPLPLKDAARASFFLTDRGYLAAEHAMERAKAILAKSARSLEVSFEGSWEGLKTITTDTSLTLTDPRLPGGEVRGKVVKYALIAKGETGERFVQITLSCTAGAPIPVKEVLPPIPLYAQDYCGESYQAHEKVHATTPSGLKYFRYDDKQPPETSKGSLLRKIELMNGPQEQEEEIIKQTKGQPERLKQALSQKATHLRLHFKDLRTKEKIHHIIPVLMAAPWASPKQYSV